MGMGLDGETLRKGNKGLISCIISGYGTTGVAKKKKAYDFLAQGEAGLCAVTGTEETPARVGVSIADLFNWVDCIFSNTESTNSERQKRPGV